MSEIAISIAQKTAAIAGRANGLAERSRSLEITIEKARESSPDGKIQMTVSGLGNSVRICREVVENAAREELTAITAECEEIAHLISPVVFSEEPK